MKNIQPIFNTTFELGKTLIIENSKILVVLGIATGALSLLALIYKRLNGERFHPSMENP